MYQPVLSRFQSLDPVSPNGVDLLDDNNWFGNRLTRMRNRYGYANNNPTRFVDPSGLFPQLYCCQCKCDDLAITTVGWRLISHPGQRLDYPFPVTLLGYVWKASATTTGDRDCSIDRWLSGSIDVAIDGGDWRRFKTAGPIQQYISDGRCEMPGFPFSKIDRYDCNSDFDWNKCSGNIELLDAPGPVVSGLYYGVYPLPTPASSYCARLDLDFTVRCSGGNFFDSIEKRLVLQKSVCLYYGPGGTITHVIDTDTGERIDPKPIPLPE